MVSRRETKAMPGVTRKRASYARERPKWSCAQLAQLAGSVKMLDVHAEWTMHAC
jgi:hypothetical protein